MVFSAIGAWAKAQDELKTNFIMYEEKEPDADAIMTEWQGRSMYQILEDIHICKSAKPQSPRQKFVADNAGMLERMFRSLGDTPLKRPYFVADDPTIPLFLDLSPPPSQTLFKYVDLDLNEIKEFSGKEWI